jgi:hypothetical protein
LCSHFVLDKLTQTRYTEPHRPNPETQGADHPSAGREPGPATVDNALNQLG